jgi:hypothetical protein
MEHEHKKKLLFHTFEPSIKKGNHTFVLEVKDERDNTAIYKADFTR